MGEFYPQCNYKFLFRRKPIFVEALHQFPQMWRETLSVIISFILLVFKGQGESALLSNTLGEKTIFTVQIYLNVLKYINIHLLEKKNGLDIKS